MNISGELEQDFNKQEFEKMVIDLIKEHVGDAHEIYTNFRKTN